MTPPQHICPRCKEPQVPEAFINEAGKATKWCSWCRASYRERLTSLHARDKTKLKREEAIDVAGIAKAEGYADHPLAQLLALSHIAGAKRALAIRDGSSWRGKKAWRAYYEVKRALETQLQEWQQSVVTELMVRARCAELGLTEAQTTALTSYYQKCDPNSDDVS